MAEGEGDAAMSTTRVMNGLVDFTGTSVNTLKVGRMIQRNPEPQYETTCSVCQSRSSATQSQVRHGAARCKSAACGKAVPNRRERLDEERREAAQRRADLESAEREASARRMAYEVDGYDLPERFAPKPTERREMSERERLSLRKFNEVEEAAQREAERPAREAQERAERERRRNERVDQERQEKQRRYWKEAVETSPDPKLFVSPELATASMPKAKADAFNAEQVQKFIADTPDYAEYRTPENSTAILDYLARNGLTIADAATYRAAYHRLRDLGILSKKVAPEVKPASASTRTVAHAVTPTENSNLEHGWDHLTGQPLTLNRRQVALLSADDYRRFKRLDKAALALPNHL